MKRLVALILVAMSLTACGTVAGLGKDITGAAEWSKEKMGGSK